MAAPALGLSREHRRALRAWRRRWLTGPLLLAGALAALGALRLMSVDRASDLGGRIGRAVGRFAGAANRRARDNLRRLRPGANAAEQDALIRAMWDNIGRVVAEYAVLDRLWAEGRIEMVNGAYAAEIVAQGQPVIFVSAHLANWEIGPLAALGRLGIAVHAIFRRPRHEGLEPVLDRLRRAGGAVPLARGASVIAALFGALEARRHVGLLVDQMTHRGVTLPAFGGAAVTPGVLPLLAGISERFGARLMPVRVERLDGARFRVTGYPVLDANRNDPQATMTAIDKLLAGWIRERPEQWLWLHRGIDLTADPAG